MLGEGIIDFFMNTAKKSGKQLKQAVGHLPLFRAFDMGM